MASITDTNRNYLELLMQNYPEYKAGLFESTAPVSFDDIFKAPTGPLYNVHPTPQQFESSSSFFDEGDVDVGTFAPKGPLYDVDPDRSKEIIDSLYASGDIEGARNLEGQFTFHEPIDEKGDFSLSQNIYDAGVAPSYSEWQENPDFRFPEKKFAGNVNLSDMRPWGRTHGMPVLNQEGELEPSWIQMQENLMDLVGTQPTSPRNEELIDASKASLGWQKPDDINKFAAGVLGHEYRHNLLNMPGFTDIRDEVMGTNINKLFVNPKSVVQFPSLYNQGIYEAGADQDMSEHQKEELFNEVLDMYNQYQLEGNMSGILSQVNPEWTNAELMKHLENNNFFQYSGKNPNQKFRWGSASSDYINQMWPLAKKYFAEVDRQGRMGPVNKAKLKVGMPENLSFDTGAGNIPTPKRTYVAPPGPHRGEGRRQRGSMPTGTAGRNPWGRAHGGLIDIPLPGRSRDI